MKKIVDKITVDKINVGESGDMFPNDGNIVPNDGNVDPNYSQELVENETKGTLIKVLDEYEHISHILKIFTKTHLV